MDAGGTLAGTGTVSSTASLPAARWLPATATPFGALTVQGGLGFASGATYSVQVSPDNAGMTNVTGTATLGGATVAANFAKGGYVAKQYSILHANGVSGSFGQLVNANLLPFLSPS